MSDFHETLEYVCERNVTKKEFLDILSKILPNHICIKNLSIAHREDYSQKPFSSLYCEYVKYADGFEVSFLVDELNNIWGVEE